MQGVILYIHSTGNICPQGTLRFSNYYYLFIVDIKRWERNRKKKRALEINDPYVLIPKGITLAIFE